MAAAKFLWVFPQRLFENSFLRWVCAPILYFHALLRCSPTNTGLESLLTACVLVDALFLAVVGGAWGAVSFEEVWDYSARNSPGGIVGCFDSYKGVVQVDEEGPLSAGVALSNVCAAAFCIYILSITVFILLYINKTTLLPNDNIEPGTVDYAIAQIKMEMWFKRNSVFLLLALGFLFSGIGFTVALFSILAQIKFPNLYLIRLCEDAGWVLDPATGLYINGTIVPNPWESCYNSRFWGGCTDNLDPMKNWKIFALVVIFGICGALWVIGGNTASVLKAGHRAEERHNSLRMDVLSNLKLEPKNEERETSGHP